MEHIEQNSFLFHITRHIILLSNEEKNYSYIVRVGSCKSRAIQSMHMEYIKSPKDVLYSSGLDKGKMYYVPLIYTSDKNWIETTMCKISSAYLFDFWSRSLNFATSCFVLSFTFSLLIWCRNTTLSRLCFTHINVPNSQLYSLMFNSHTHTIKLKSLHRMQYVWILFSFHFLYFGFWNKNVMKN